MPLSSVVGASSILRPGVCTSTSRPASPFEGQTIYETDTDQLLTYNGSGWKPFADVTASTNGAVLQIVSTTKTDTFTMSSGTFADVTGLSATITPSSTSSKIFVSCTMHGAGQGSATVGHYRLMRDSTAICVGDAAGSRVRASGYVNADDRPESTSFSTLDSPSTTSAVTYKVQARNEGNSSAVYVNRGHADTDGGIYARLASTITVMEISG